MPDINGAQKGFYILINPKLAETRLSRCNIFVKLLVIINEEIRLLFLFKEIKDNLKFEIKSQILKFSVVFS